MDYEPYDSSGTDDDLPPPHQNRIPRGGHITGNGRSGVLGSVPYPRMYSESDMEAQIHQLEQEAYISLIKAFKAQADAITWDKENLMTELRKELRVSNEEHKELLGKANADDVVMRIREWRRGGLQVGMLNSGQAVQEPVPSPSISASRKKQKTNPSGPSQSFGGPSPSFHPQSVAPPNQPSSSAIRRAPVLGPGPKSKKQKSGHILPGLPSMKMQYPASGPTGMGQLGNQTSFGGTTFSPLIGRKVRTRWPDDNNFYEAIITDYNPNEGRHALVYDQGTPNETWEWVDLEEISPEDIRWVGEDPGVPHKGGHGGSRHATNRSGGRDTGPGAGRGRGPLKGASRKDFPSSQNGVGKKKPEDIQLLHTDTLIKEVERVFTSSQPDPMEIEKAKSVLKEHEQALADAIARLADFSDDENDEGSGRFLHGRMME